MAFWSLFIAHPWLALLPAITFQIAWIVRFARGVSNRFVRIVAALPVGAWTLYAIYEWRMQVWSATVVAPIRIDLLLVIPLLVAVSVVGIAALAHRTAAV